MKKILTLLVLWCMLLYGDQLQRLHVRYDISYAIFGVIGVSEAMLTIDPRQKRYHIVNTGRAKGVAKLMSAHRVERYESEGRVVDGLLVPEYFTTITEKGKYYKEVHRYRFDHAKHRVWHLKRLTTREGTTESERLLGFYAKDDVQTLFFNLPRYVRHGICKANRCTLYAVGANEKDGRVDIYPAKHGMLRVILHRRIFASKRGEIFVHLTKEGISDFAMLKDVIFFGDIKAKATKIEKNYTTKGK